MMAEPEDDVYYDAISTGGNLTEKKTVPEVQTSQLYEHSDITDALDVNFTEGGLSDNKFHSDVLAADSDHVPIRKDILTDAQKNTGLAAHDQRGGRVLEIAAQFAGKPSGVQNDSHSKQATYFTEPEYRQGEQRSSIGYVNTKPHPAFTVLDHGEQGKSAYCFAKPFPEDVNRTMEQIQTEYKCERQMTEIQRPDSLIDSIGYSHPNKFTGEREQLPNEQAQVQNVGENQTYPDNWTQENYDVGSPDAFTVISDHRQNLRVQQDINGDYEVYDDQNLYDSVHNSLNRSGPNSLDFEVIDHKGSSQSDHLKKKYGRGQTGERKKMKAMADEVSNELKRRQARKESRAMKRSLKKSGGNPFTSHSNFDDPHKGALPEAENEVEGPLHVFGPDHHDDSDSGSSFFTDSTFDSTSDSEKEFFSCKPLPPPPDRKDQGNVGLFEVNQGHPRRNNGDEVMPILHKVNLRRPRSPPALPQTARNIAPNQAKVRGVLQSLIDSERNYITSLERITTVYKEFILSHIKKQEVKVTFQKVEEIVSLHQMFQIELSDKLKKWNDEERIGSIFSHFSREMVVDIYSIYVNNYEVASEQIQEAENSKQAFREFIKKKQGESPDKLSLPALMLKPIQRFPQFIMIIKDLLKYTPRDHHDREELQEAVTWIENVAHQLNERKRQSEQLYHGQQIMAKLAPRIHPEKNVFLIRQDDMEQISHDVTGSHIAVKQRRIFLMNDRLVSVHVTQRDQDGMSTEKYTYKWHQSLRDLDLTTSAITPSMQTTVSVGSSSSTIVSPKTDKSEEDPYSVASELTDMIHDVSVLAQINQMVASLKLSYQGLTEDLIHGIITSLQKDIQGKDYQLQMLNSNTIIIQDRPRKKKYVFSAASAIAKQEWCIDFLMAKFALDITNIPSWHKPDSKETIQPALLMKHMSVDMQRTFTRISCGVKVYFPRRNEGSVEHLWVCSSTDSQGQVSIVSLHTDKPSLIESFQATKCEIICVESVPGFARVVDNAAFEEDTVWMSTADAVIQVFKLSEKDPELHRQCVHTFNVGCIVISMRYIDDVVFCGNRNGMVVIVKRNDAGVWSVAQRITLGTYPVISMICVGDYLWVSCGNKIHVLDIDELEVEGTVDTQCVTTEDSQYIFQYLVKIGVGVWASFVGQPNVCLYHSESRRLLQDVNVTTAVHEFIKVYKCVEERKNFQVTSLMASLGLLWIGTNVGIILVYPLPRLRDGVPRINERPLVALHSHNGPVKFLIPVHYGPVGSSPIRRRPESVLRKFNVDDTILKKLSKVDEHGNSRAHLDNGITEDNFYEDVNFKGYIAESDNIYADIPEENNRQQNEDKVKHAIYPGDQTSEFKSDTNEQESELYKSDEHKYFVLERHGRVTDDSGLNTKGDNAGPNGENDVTIRPKPNRSPQWHRSISLAEDASRKSLTLSHDSFRRKRDNVQFELAKKLKQRKSLEDLTDRDATQDEVGILYPTLLRPQTMHRSVKNRASSMFDNPIPENLFQQFGGSQDSLYYRPGMTTPILTRKPDITSTRNLSLSNYEKKEKSPSPEQKKKKSPRGERRSVSFNQNDTKESKLDMMQNNRKSAVGTSFASGSSIDTLRKQGSNTIMVLSGGDGYNDWKKRQSLPNIRPEEPFLMFWMYRF